MYTASKIGAPARHADDQRADAIRAVALDVRAPATRKQPSTESASGPAEALAWRKGRGERSSRSRKLRRSALRPIAEVLAVEAGGAEQLADGLVVEGAVLADIEIGEMKAEGLDRAQDGAHIERREPPGADFDQRIVEQPADGPPVRTG